MRATFLRATCVSFLCLVSCGAETTDSTRMVLGASGYTLHHGPGDGRSEYVLSLNASENGMPSISLLLTGRRQVGRIITMTDYGDRVLFYIDTDGDGLPDEGMERDKVKGTLEKFRLRFVREEKGD